MDRFIGSQEDVFSLIARSLLPEECKRLHEAHVEDRIKAFSHSFAEWKRSRETATPAGGG